MRIAAGLHAALRWDRKRKYKRNDFNDFHHAIAAIPYCDFFLTDHGLRHLVAHKRLRFSEFFACKTLSGIADSLQALSRIA